MITDFAGKVKARIVKCSNIFSYVSEFSTETFTLVKKPKQKVRIGTKQRKNISCRIRKAGRRWKRRPGRKRQ